MYKTNNLSFFGEVEQLSCCEAYEMLKEENSYLIDVRTKAEWEFVGIPSLIELGKNVIFLSWQFYPSMQLNENFCEELDEIIKDKEAKLFFICRSGGRSYYAARSMIDYGYKYCYNLEDGFEGNPNGEGKRSTISGWRMENLPWHQT